MGKFKEPAYLSCDIFRKEFLTFCLLPFKVIYRPVYVSVEARYISALHCPYPTGDFRGRGAALVC